MNRKKAQLEDYYKDAKIKHGKGNFDGGIMMIYEGPEFKSSDILKNECKKANIPIGQLYITPIKKGFKNTDKKEVLQLLQAEIAVVNPKVIWTIGNFPLEVLGIKVPMVKAYGKYFPYLQRDFFSFIVPDRDMIAKMPKRIRREFSERVKKFSKEIRSKGPIPKIRRADYSFMYEFNKAEGFEFDRSLSGPKTYYMLFSEEIQDHLFVLPTEKAKRFFKERIPFGMKFTQDEVNDITPEAVDVISKIKKKYGGEVIDVDLNAIKERIG